MAYPLTNMKHLPFEYLDITATTHYLCRLALNRVNYEVNDGIDNYKCEFLGGERNGGSTVNKSGSLTLEVIVYYCKY